MILRPLFAKNSGVTLDLLELDVDMLFKVNEYLDIRDYVEKKETEAEQKRQKLESMRQGGGPVR